MGKKIFSQKLEAIFTGVGDQTAQIKVDNVAVKRNTTQSHRLSHIN